MRYNASCRMLYKLDFKPDTCFAFKGWNAYENAKDISRISRMTFQKFKQRQGGSGPNVRNL